MEMKCDELWTRDDRILKKQAEIAQLGLKVVGPRETKVLPGDYRQPTLSLSTKQNAE
jgi:hypothetical protein